MFSRYKARGHFILYTSIAYEFIQFEDFLNIKDFNTIIGYGNILKYIFMKRILRNKFMEGKNLIRNNIKLKFNIRNQHYYNGVN